MLVIDFIEGAVEIGDADIDVDVIDQGLTIIRQLWDAGLGHRDIKPANLMVRDGKVFLIDAAFLQVRPSPWRQAVDLGNMMLVLALRSDAATVYERALRWFTPDEIAEAFAATRGVASPTQLRSQMKKDGRDLIDEFKSMAPARTPISLQRWSFKRVFLALAVLGLTLFVVSQLFMLVRPAHDVEVTHTPACGTESVTILVAQSVPSATLVPCVAAIPSGWELGGVHVRRGRADFELSSDLDGIRGTEEAEVEVTLQPVDDCDVSGASQVPSDEIGADRFEQIERLPPGLAAIRYYLFPGGCVTYRYRLQRRRQPGPRLRRRSGAGVPGPRRCSSTT